MGEEEGRKLRAVKLKTGERIGLGVAGVILGAFAGPGCLLASRGYRPPGCLSRSADNSGGCLCVFAITGRLPTGFEVGGVSVEFGEDEPADLIANIHQTTVEDEERRETLLNPIEEAVGSRQFNKAMRAAQSQGAEQLGGFDGLDTPDEHAAAIGDAGIATGHKPHTGMGKILRKAFPDGVEDHVWVTGSGTVKPPKYRYVATTKNGKRVAIQLVDYWNSSELELVRKRASRALAPDTDVNAVLVLAPKRGVKEFESQLQGMDRAGVLDRELVQQSGDAAREALQDKVADLVGGL